MKIALFILTTGLFLFQGCDPGTNRSDKKYDLVIYGGTSAGVVAAIQGKRLGLSVVLVMVPGT